VLGWIVSGKTPAINPSSSTQRSFFLRETTPLEANLNRFWEVQPEPCLTFTPEQQACEQHFLNHTHQQEDGRFIVDSTEELEIKRVHIALTDGTDDFMQRFSKLNRLL
jgi:hypothetical protein